ncbi:MAG: SufE family protein [Enterobacterales bacterium]|nr:SufE family protein [Enterobacterales bacterium]
MIQTTEIIETLSFFDCWEDRYRYMIELGKELPAMDNDLKTQDKLVPGCQSRVWIDWKNINGLLHFEVDSDALIVKGLLALVMAAYQDKSANDIIEFDIQNYFEQLDLIKHLSPTRGNGLQAMIGKIQGAARQMLD